MQATFTGAPAFANPEVKPTEFGKALALYVWTDFADIVAIANKTIRDPRRERERIIKMIQTAIEEVAALKKGSGPTAKQALLTWHCLSRAVFIVAALGPNHSRNKIRIDRAGMDEDTKKMAHMYNDQMIKLLSLFEIKGTVLQSAFPDLVLEARAWMMKNTTWIPQSFVDAKILPPVYQFPGSAPIIPNNSYRVDGYCAFQMAFSKAIGGQYNATIALAACSWILGDAPKDEKEALDNLVEVDEQSTKIANGVINKNWQMPQDTAQYESDPKRKPKSDNNNQNPNNNNVPPQGFYYPPGFGFGGYNPGAQGFTFGRQ